MSAVGKIVKSVTGAVGKAVGSVAQAVGLAPSPPRAAAPAPAAPSAPAPAAAAAPVSAAAAPTAPPSIATEAVQAAADMARMRERRARGRAATMLTSQEDYSAPQVSVARLLGGSR